MVAAIVVGVIAASAPGETVWTDTVSPTTAVAPATTEPAAPNETTVPPPTDGAPSSTTAPEHPPHNSRVSYLSPPPELAIRPLGSISVPDPLVGNYSAAIGDFGVAVSSSNYGDLGPARIDVVGFDGQTRSIDGPPGTWIIAYGPGDVAYASLPGDSLEDFAVVAVALSGTNTGTVVASTPQNVNRFLEYPRSSFGHSESGVADRRPDRIDLTSPTPYVNVEGEPISMDPPPDWFTLSSPLPSGSNAGGIVRSSTGVSWSLVVEAASNRANPYVDDSLVAAGPDGRGLYWTHIGPDAAPGQDFGEATMWVVAEMRPDGSATWWSLPDGWHIVASDVWGTVLAHQDGTRLQLALADFGGNPDAAAARWTPSSFEPGATWLGYSGNWDGEAPSPPAPANGQTPADGYYVASVLEPWSPQRPGALPVRVQRLEWCSALPDGCEYMQPSEMNLDPSWHLDLDLPLDATTNVVVQGFRCFEVPELKQATGADLRDLFEAYTADYATLVEPLLPTVTPEHVATAIADTPSTGFVDSNDLCADDAPRNIGELLYTHADAPTLLAEPIYYATDGPLRATDLVALLGVQYTQGEPTFYFHAGFTS